MLDLAQPPLCASDKGLCGLILRVPPCALVPSGRQTSEEGRERRDRGRPDRDSYGRPGRKHSRIVSSLGSSDNYSADVPQQSTPATTLAPVSLSGNARLALRQQYACVALQTSSGRTQGRLRRLGSEQLARALLALGIVR